MRLLSMLCGGLFFLLLLAAVVALVIWAMRSSTRGGGGTAGLPGSSATLTGSAGPSRALDILKERYARGEITKEQYEEMRRDLTV